MLGRAKAMRQAMIDDPTQPFVLLDDARAGGSARLFTGVRATIVAATAAEVRPAFDRLRAAGGHRAGFVAFDAGFALEPALVSRAPSGGDGLPLVWFGVFDRAQAVAAADLPQVGPAQVGAVVPDIDEATFTGRVAAILALIQAGDLYQANLTFAATVAIAGHPLALYRRLRTAAQAPHSALVHTGTAWLLSFSPELFFTLERGIVTTRPMKGTAPRGSTADDDDDAAAALAADPKNRAENLMIVDLLRNDLSRVGTAVAVPALFAVERYPTLLQMTSTVTANTAADAVEVLTTLFPCGSVTGAPKIAAMAAIARIEGAARGVYTGSIGAISTDGSATFNVAIRTLVMTRAGEARIGLGAGIVADSIAADEWRECLAKGTFLARGPVPAIIATMRVAEGVAEHLDRHLERVGATALFLGIRTDGSMLLDAVAAAAASTFDARLRLVIAPSGRHAIELSPLPPVPAAPVAVALAPLPVAASDWQLRHKTTDRRFYDAARRTSGAFEVVFVTPDGRLTEGSFTNVFVAGDGVLRTPPLAAGLLPGILRAHLLATGAAVEADLTAADLAGGFFVGNALRGLIAARLVGEAGRPSAPRPGDQAQTTGHQRGGGRIGERGGERREGRGVDDRRGGGSGEGESDGDDGEAHE